MKKFNLRQATYEDREFLYDVSNKAMQHVRDVTGHKAPTFEEYSKKYPVERIQVIQFEGRDVGRLRVVRDNQSIYVGGIQILPEFQHNGIGTSLFEDLVRESNETKIPITLEVQNVNAGARALYLRLGFKITEVEEEKSKLKYIPV